MGWISIKSSLPELYEDVLLHHMDGTILIGNRFQFGFLFSDLYGKGTHWMPLPDPPTK